VSLEVFCFQAVTLVSGAQLARTNAESVVKARAMKSLANARASWDISEHSVTEGVARVVLVVNVMLSQGSVCVNCLITHTTITIVHMYVFSVALFLVTQPTVHALPIAERDFTTGDVLEYVALVAMLLHVIS